MDPPPDDEYPLFIEDNKERRTLAFVGANDGMVHAIDGRTGLEVWAFIPYNLLPKVNALRYGLPVDGFVYSMDGSPKIADVKVNVSGTQTWKTYMTIGEGPGGTFYQAFDVTHAGSRKLRRQRRGGERVHAARLLQQHHAHPAQVELPEHLALRSGGRAPSATSLSTATAVEKTVGQTWSDPAVGQIENQDGTYAVLAGSGFFPRSSELSAAAGGCRGGTLVLPARRQHRRGDRLD